MKDKIVLVLKKRVLFFLFLFVLINSSLGILIFAYCMEKASKPNLKQTVFF